MIPKYLDLNYKNHTSRDVIVLWLGGTGRVLLFFVIWVFLAAVCAFLLLFAVLDMGLVADYGLLLCCFVFCLCVVVGGSLCTTSFRGLFFGLSFVFWFVWLTCFGCAGCHNLMLGCKVRGSFSETA